MPQADTPRSERITGAVLAGGRATRMGGQDKGLVELAGRPMVEHVLHALRPQVDTILINANRNHEQYAAYGHPVIADEQADFKGPLAGIAACMACAETELMLALPCDGPLVPDDLACRLHRALQTENAAIAVAHDGTRMQPTFALIRTELLPSLQHYLHEGERKVAGWYARHRLTQVDFSDRADTFINVNTPGDRDELARRLSG